MAYVHRKVTQPAGRVKFAKGLFDVMSRGGAVASNKLSVAARKSGGNGPARVGVEEAARVARHQFFAEQVGRLGAAGVALAHTADDQAETVLLRLIRGTGLRGLAAMRPVTVISVRPAEAAATVSLRLLRPMLRASRDAVRAYLDAQGLPFRVDSSNETPDYTRNRVRTSLLSALRAENPRIVEALCRLADTAADDYDYLEARALEALGSLAVFDRDSARVDLAAWNMLPRALRREALRLAYTRIRGSEAELTVTHVEDALRCVESLATGSRIDWPSGLIVAVGAGSFTIGPSSTLKEPRRFGPLALPVPGEVAVPAGRRVVAERRVAPCPWSRDERYHADLAASAIVGGLRLRSRRPGDRLVPLGMMGSRKVQDLLVDAKVPRAERDQVPIVEDDAGIVWLAGHRQAERTRVGASCADVICLRLRADESRTPDS